MSTVTLMLLLLALCGISFRLVTPILFRLYRRCRIEEITPEWLESFSPSTYYPMQGLLADEDFQFLLRQPGFDLSLYRKLRRERLNIFRQYLNRLILDFNRLHQAARVLLAHGRDDRSDLVTQLVWLKIRFSAAVLQAEFSFLLCRIGFRSLAVRTVILHLEEMSSHLSSIAAAQAA